MAERALSCYRLSFNEGYHPDRELQPANLNGRDLFDVIRDWCENCVSPSDLNLDSESLQIRLGSGAMRIPGERMILVTVEGGVSREPGPVVDVGTHRDTGKYISVHEAPFSATRALFFVPQSGSPAIVFCESSARGNGANKLIAKFVDYWRRSIEFDGITINREAALRSPDWIEENGTIKDLIVKRYIKPRFFGDRVEEERLTLVVKLSPPRSRRFDFSLIRRIQRNLSEAGKYMHLEPAGADEKETVYATIDLENKKQRQIEISDQLAGFPILEVLNDERSEPIEDQAFVSICTELAEEYYEDLRR